MAGRRKQETLVDDDVKVEADRDEIIETQEIKNEEPRAEAPKAADTNGSMSKSDIMTVIREMICRPKPRGSVPTFVTFKERDQIPDRHIILDVPQPFLEEAWNYYKSNARRPEADEFLIMVYDILESGIPRLYRKVAKLTLD